MNKEDFDLINRNGIDWEIYKNTTVLVTGCTGRIGMYILGALVTANKLYNLNMHVIGVCRSKNKAMQVFGDDFESDCVDFLYQDINTQFPILKKIDYIYHTAGPAAPQDFKSIPVETLWSHVNGTRNVLECAISSHVKRVFYVSTVEIYGEWNSDDLITESDMGPIRNDIVRACYPEAKRLCETMLSTYKQEYGIDYCGVRLSHTLGPGISLNDGRAFAEFINCLLEDRNIELLSSGDAIRPYTYVADVVNAIFLIMEKGDSCFYNVANNGNLISIKDLAELIASFSVTGNTKVVFGKDCKNLPYLPFRLAIMDTSKIEALGWKPIVDIRSTFEKTISSFVK